VALSSFLKKEEQYLGLGHFLQQKRDYFQDLMEGTVFTPLTSHGSYFQIYSYANISDEEEKTFAVWLTKEHGVATIPVAAFYQSGVNNQVLRFCFSKREQTLEAAAEKLAKIR
jgi:methionine aminotransferase